MKPRKPILDRSFVYVPSHATDVSKTFARARRELAAQKKRDADNKAEAARKLIPIKANQ